MKKAMIGTLAAGLLVIGLAACGVPEATGTPTGGSTGGTVSQGFGSKDASADVTLGVATDDGSGFMAISVPVIVTNHSDGPSNYIIEVAASVGGVRVDTDPLVSVNNLAPGATAEEQAKMWTDDRVTADSVFEVISVTRLASN